MATVQSFGEWVLKRERFRCELRARCTAPGAQSRERWAFLPGNSPAENGCEWRVGGGRGPENKPSPLLCRTRVCARIRLNTTLRLAPTLRPCHDLGQLPQLLVLGLAEPDGTARLTRGSAFRHGRTRQSARRDRALLPTRSKRPHPPRSVAQNRRPCPS